MLFHDPFLSSRCADNPLLQIQDNAHATDRSRPPEHGQHHFVRHGPPRRGVLALDVFHSSSNPRDSTYIQQHNHEWGPFAENLDPAHTLRSVQPDPAHGFVVFTSPWEDEAYDGPEADGLRPSGGLSPPSTNAELSLRLQEVHTYDAFSSYPNAVSEEAGFPRNDGQLIQSNHSPHHLARAFSTFGQTHPNQIRLSSGSQGPSLIASEKYVRCKKSGFISVAMLKV